MRSMMWRLIAAVTMVCCVAQAQAGSYRFYLGANPEAIAPQACSKQPWSNSADEACAAVAAFLTPCDRSVEHRSVATTLVAPVACLLSWEYRELTGTNWFSWSLGLSLQSCEDPYTPDVTSGECTLEISIPYALGPPPPDCEVCKGNPIYPLRGVKREVVDTGLLIGNMTLQFTYDNSAKIPKVWTSPPTSSTGERQRYGKLGSLLWFSNLHRSVALMRSSDSTSATLPNPTVFDRGTGVSRTMTSTATTPSTAEPGNADRFVPLAGGGYVYTDATSNVQERYTSAGQLTAMAWTDGTQVNFSYDGAGMLTQASDTRGRSLSFAYTAGPEGSTRMSTITDANGQVTTLGFDARNNLASVTWHNGTTKTLLYERTDLPWALTGVSDERGLRYATFGYDPEGRAISTEHAGGVDKYAVSYAVPPSIRVTEQRDGIYVARIYDWIAPQGIVMTEPSGQVTNWSALSLNGKNYFSSQTQPAGAGSLQSSRSQAYDANGNIASRDDFNGKRSCYLNDLARNRRVAEVNGLSQGQDCATVTTANAALPAGALKTSTQWHPDWSLPIKVAEPKQITINVYNGQPDPLNGNAIASCAPTAATSLDGKPTPTLCKQVTRATTDADGHLGFAATLQAGTIDTVRTWTYDADGRVLTTKGSRTDVNDASTLGYYADTNADHTKGDLRSITNARGQVTTFDRYNKYGQVLQSTDPSGVVTVNTYDLRQRLLTNTVGGETTTYTYDAAGQLTLVTEHDGTWTGFEYDDAHRQTAVKDEEGNRIDYVLDNAGNQTDQRVKDPAGALKRNAARVMDALGRAQQSAGRE
jgi:YD repeat-containing protein